MDLIDVACGRFIRQGDSNVYLSFLSSKQPSRHPYPVPEALPSP